MKICPDASVHDGKFHITVLNGLPKLKFLKLFSTVYDGSHIKHPVVQVYEASELIIQSSLYSRYQVDGEVIGSTPAKITAIPNGLTILGS